MGFQTPQLDIADLIRDVRQGEIQLPDFQRDYRWDDDRIRELLVTVLRGHPMGILMMLDTSNEHVHFQPRTLERVAEDAAIAGAPLGAPDYLLLDGQQRMTSLYQALAGTGVVETKDARGKKVKRRYFLDVRLALGAPEEQHRAVISLPEDGVLRENIGRDVVLDVSTRELQLEHGLMPFTCVFDREQSASRWLFAYAASGDGRLSTAEEFNTVLSKIDNYKIPAILLDKETTKEAVATVFNKVNRGGLPLDNFELLTAIFAGDKGYFDTHGEYFRLRDDWAETRKVLDAWSALPQIKETDFLQMVLLLASLERRDADVAAGKERPRRVTGRGDDVLDLTLDEYLHWAPLVRQALPWTAQFLTSLHIHEDAFLPYRTQTVPLTVFKVLLGDDADVHTVRDRIRRWYWCGVLGELYGGATETRFARDVEQVPPWARAAKAGFDAVAPKTVVDAQFSESRLWSLQTRNSAAYKGLYALMLAQGPVDWKHDVHMDHASYFDLKVDIHHIFPRKYCEDAGIDKERWNSVVNKTPLSKKTNIWLRGDSPAVYVERLQRDQSLTSERLDELLATHLIDPTALRDADFDAFFAARQEALVGLIEQATGKPVFRDLAQGVPTELPEAYEPEPDDVDDADLDATEYEGAID